MAVNVTEERLELTAIDKASAVVGQVQKSFVQLKTGIDVVTGALAGLGVAVSAGAMVAMYADIIKATAALDDMAESTGASVAELSKLQAVAKIGGHDFGGLTDAIGKMIKGLKGADEEGQAASHALEFLGVKAKDANGRFRDGAVLLQEIAKALVKYEDGGNKVALVQDALGKGAQRYLPFLKDLAEEGEVAAKVTAEQASQAEQLEKNMNRLRGAMEDAKREMVLGFVPGLIEVTQKMIAAQRAGDGMIGGLRLLLTASVGNGSDDVDKRIVELSEVVRKYEAEIKIAQRLPFFGSVVEDMRKSQKQASQELAYLTTMRPPVQPGMQDFTDWMEPGPKGRLNYASPDKGKGGAATGSKPRSLEDLLAAGAGFDKHYRAELELLAGAYTKGKIAVDVYTQAVTELIEKQKWSRDAIAQDKMIREAEAKHAEEMAKRTEIRTKALAGLVERQKEQLSNAKTELENLGKTPAEIEKANALRQVDADLRKTINDLAEQELELTGEELELLFDKADAQRRNVAIAITEKNERLEAMKLLEDEARRRTEAIARTADNLERAFTNGIVDGLMVGFRRGESLTEAFWRTMESLAKTAVLEPLIQPLVRPISNAIAGAASGFANGLTGGGGIGGLFSAASGANTLSGWMGGPSIGGAFSGMMGTSGVGATAALGELGINTAFMSEAALASASAAGVGAGTGVMGAMGGMGALGPIGLAIGGALLLSSLMDEGGQPKASDAFLRRRANGDFGVEMNNVAGGDPDLSLVMALNRSLNDPKQFDPARLAGLTDTMVSTGSPADTATLLNQLSSVLGPAAEAAVANAARSTKEREIEIALMEAEGRTVEALAERRKDELAAMDASLRPMAERIYAAQDLARAQILEAGQAATQRELDIRLMEMQGDATGALAARRREELAAMTPAQQATMKLIHALEDQAVAAQAQAEAAQRQAEIEAQAAIEKAQRDAERTMREQAAAAKQRELDIRLMEWQGNAAGALAARREDELAALEPAQQATLRMIHALEDQAAAADAAAEAADAAARATAAAAASLRDLSTAGFSTLVDYTRAHRMESNRLGIAPRFAGGGSHGGGWRVVGEQGWELEQTGPSRIYSNADSRSLLDMSGVVDELAALRGDVRNGDIALARTLGEIRTLAKRWDSKGLLIRADEDLPVPVEVIT